MGRICRPSVIRPARSGHSRSVIAVSKRQDALGDLGPLRYRETQMPECMRRQQAAARRATDETLLNEKRLDDFLDCIARLRERGGDGFDADRSAGEIDRDAAQVAAVERIEPAA